MTAIADRIRGQTSLPRLVQAVLGPRQPAAFPTVQVSRLNETAGPQQILTLASQRVDVRVAVDVWVASARDVGDADPIEDVLDPLLDEVRTALLGWAPTADWTPLELVFGEAADVQPGVVRWRDVWRTAGLVRAVA